MQCVMFILDTAALFDYSKCLYSLVNSIDRASSTYTEFNLVYDVTPLKLASKLNLQNSHDTLVCTVISFFP